MIDGALHVQSLIYISSVISGISFCIYFLDSAWGFKIHHVVVVVVCACVCVVASTCCWHVVLCAECPLCSPVPCSSGDHVDASVLCYLL